MMRMRTMAAGKAPPPPSPPEEEKGSPAGGKPASWEVRPGGMLVQKRVSGDVGAAAAPPVPNIRVRVKHGDVYHEIYISAQSSFGDLKKMVSERTGMHPLDQKVVYKKRERSSGAFLDTSGVKDGSKVVVMEDPAAQARRCLEMRRSAKMEKASKSISEIGLEVDKLASKVSEISAVVGRGSKVPENDLTALIEMLMNQLIKLDGIVADGDVKAQRRMQVRRVQRHVEALDVLKIRNAAAAAPPPDLKAAPAPATPPPPVASKRVPSPEDRRPATAAPEQQQHQQPRKGEAPAASPAPVVVTTKWEMFDSLFSPTSSSAAAAPTKFGSAAGAAPTKLGSAAAAGKLDWELF